MPAAPPAIDFGLFDWIDRRDAPVDQIFEERLHLLETADAAGFYCYHLAEHHATPLSLAPSPGLFLSAATQRTRRIRLGPLVYLLPLYDPLRLLKEIAMLDQLSGGRLELGVGRGVSPYELRYFHREAKESRAIFLEALEVLRIGLTHDRLTFHGKYFTYDDVPIEIHPKQQPYPPIWYPTSNLESVPWAAREGLHLMGQAANRDMRAANDLYREEWIKHRDDPTRLNAHVTDPRLGVLRLVYLAESDEQALAEARQVHRDWFASFVHLWHVYGDTTHDVRGDFDRAVSGGALFAGSPETVRDQITRLVDEVGCNYLVLAFHWGSQTHAQARRSLRLFVDEVMPAFPGTLPRLSPRR